MVFTLVELDLCAVFIFLYFSAILLKSEVSLLLCPQVTFLTVSGPLCDNVKLTYVALAGNYV